MEKSNKPKNNCLRQMFVKEKREHPTLPDKSVRTIVTDHMKKKEYSNKCKRK